VSEGAATAASSNAASGIKSTTPTATSTTAVLSATASASAAPEAIVLPQGMGKAVVVPSGDDIEVRADGSAEKRDLAGFNAALAFATGALKTSPEVQLGTGAEGSGVGILQKAGGAPATAAKAA
jgi:hypothetical protein